jgi:hypothetical protein
MATLILKSLAAGYVLVFLFGLVLMSQTTGIPAWGYLFMPILFWPATLIIAAIALLVFIAILEHKK